jgi:LysM repeat protein
MNKYTRYTCSILEGEPEMKSSHLRFLLVVVLVLALLSACNRPASKAPVATATATSELPFPMPGQPTVFKDIAAGTMTAQALLNPPVATEQPTQVVEVLASPTPVPPTQVIVFTATPGIPATYTLQLGESFYCLARRYNLDPSAIISANPNLNADSIRDGTTINLPQGPVWPESLGSRARTAHPATYVVASGDTIYKIACLYGNVSPEMIAQANNLAAPFTLTAGQSLAIP